MMKSKTIIFYLEHWSKVQPQKVAVRTEDVCLSYKELWMHTVQFACEFTKAGIQEGDTVLLFLSNCAEYLVAFYAAMGLNLNIIPANASSKAFELRRLIEDLKPKCVVVSDETRCALVKSIDNCIQRFSLFLNGKETCHSANAPWENREEKCFSMRIYVSTSGSTGKPKYIANTYQNEMINANLYTKRLGIKKDDVILTALPMTQRFGMAAMLGSCFSGCTLVLMQKFDARAALQWIQYCGVTVQYGVPTIYIKEKDAYLNALETTDISSLRTGIIAGAAGAKDIFCWFEQMGCRLLNCYGTTEIGGLTMTDYSDDFTVRSQTCGHGFPETHIEILDAMGRPVHAGESGEIVCTTPWMMLGYEGEPELTAKAFDKKGWFLTGDIGYMDTHGNLTICGRKKEIIIRGGYNVFPAEVEQALTTYTDVLEACVVGYRDAQLGERICAFVILPDKKQACAQDIRNQLMPYIAKYKLPDKVIVIDEIPKLPNGKQDHPALRAYLTEHFEKI